MTARISNGTAAMDAAIDATQRQQGDPMPTAEELIRHLRDLGYTVLPRPDADRTRPAGLQAYADEGAADLLIAYTYWLNEKRQLVKGDHDDSDELDDVALHFLAERREKAQASNAASEA